MIKNLKITTWNINGLKSLKVSMKTILDNFDSELICFQEIKSSKDTIEYSNAIVDGYNSYFSFCQSKSGYSGVGMYCRNPLIPVSMNEGLISIIKKLSLKLKTNDDICMELNISLDDLIALESEGRAICGCFQITDCACGISDIVHLVWIINVYCPMADPENKERLHYKYQFNRLLSLTLEAVINSRNPQCQNSSLVILVGDLNIVHKPIDMADTVPPQLFLSNPNRHWLNSLLIESQRCPDLNEHWKNEESAVNGNFVDTFRLLHPSEPGRYSCWNTKVGGRQTNFGTRIDYILCDRALQQRVHASELLAEIMGSDHCAVSTALLGVRLLPASSPPALCSSNIPQFRNQSKITSFLTRTQKPDNKRRSSVIPDVRDDVAPKLAKMDPLKPSQSMNSDASTQWKAIFKGPPKAPLCTGHKLASVLRTVNKDSSNKGKKFWVCAKPKGLSDNPESRCNFFQWASSI